MVTKIEILQGQGNTSLILDEAVLSIGEERALPGVSSDGKGVLFYKVTDGGNETTIDQVLQVWDNPGWRDGRIDEFNRKDGLATRRNIATLREDGGYHDLELRLVGNITPNSRDITYTARITHIKGE